MPAFEDNQQVVELPEGYLGKYSLKTGEPIPEPKEKIEKPTPPVLDENQVNLNGMTFYIGQVEEPTRFLPSSDEKDADLAYRPYLNDKSDYER